MAGNTTIILGVEDNRVDEAIDIIKKKSRSKSKQSPPSQNLGYHFAHQCLLR